MRNNFRNTLLLASITLFISCSTTQIDTNPTQNNTLPKVEQPNTETNKNTNETKQNEGTTETIPSTPNSNNVGQGTSPKKEISPDSSTKQEQEDSKPNKPSEPIAKEMDKNQSEQQNKESEDNAKVNGEAKKEEGKESMPPSTEQTQDSETQNSMKEGQTSPKGDEENQENNEVEKKDKEEVQTDSPNSGNMDKNDMPTPPTEDEKIIPNEPKDNGTEKNQENNKKEEEQSSSPESKKPNKVEEKNEQIENQNSMNNGEISSKKDEKEQTPNTDTMSQEKNEMQEQAPSEKDSKLGEQDNTVNQGKTNPLQNGGQDNDNPKKDMNNTDTTTPKDTENNQKELENKKENEPSTPGSSEEKEMGNNGMDSNSSEQKEQEPDTPQKDNMDDKKHETIPPTIPEDTGKEINGMKNESSDSLNPKTKEETSDDNQIQQNSPAVDTPPKEEKPIKDNKIDNQKDSNILPGEPKLTEKEITIEEILKEQISKENTSPNPNEENKLTLKTYKFTKKESSESEPEVTIIEADNNTPLTKRQAKEVAMNGKIRSSERRHMLEVAASFHNGDASNVDFNKVTFLNEKQKRLVDNVKGIVNMSYTYVDFNLELGSINKNSRYINKRGVNFGSTLTQYLTRALYREDYLTNDVLFVRALGNGSNVKKKTEIFSNEIATLYHSLSPELQRIARSESLMVKMGIKSKYGDTPTKEGVYKKQIFEDKQTGIKYYDGAINHSITTALPLRSFTVVEDGALFKEGSFVQGSSYSAPRIARLAHDIKKKYPFLSYQQVKQVILTTAKRDEKGYLDDNIGWGIADKDKALNGPSDFNAGLIEEQKYFDGNANKIYDEKHNRYFYVSIDKDKKYKFNNDITSGLTGDSSTTDSTTYTIKGARDKGATEEFKNYRYRLPKVLESEKLYYKDVATAGLRKDGKGTLILNGKQLYEAKSQVLDGTLVLNNNSDSFYEVYKDATLSINGIDEDKENKLKNKVENNVIKLKNIVSEGTVEFLAKKTELDNYVGLSNSTTVLKTGTEVIAKAAAIKGNIRLNVDNKDSTALEGIIKIKKDNKTREVDIETLKNVNVENIYLESQVIYKNGYYYVKFNKIFDRSKFGALKDLNETQLKDIPSYDTNQKKFFDEYSNERYGYNYKGNGYKYNSSDKTTLALLNLSAKDENEKEKIKSQIFTDVYATYISDTFENINLANVNDNATTLFDHSPQTGLYAKTYHNTNLVKGNTFTPFSKYTSINNIGGKIRLNDNAVLGISGAYKKDKYEFNNDAKFDSNQFDIALSTSVISKNKYNLTNKLNIGYNITDVKRNVLKETVENSVRSLILNYNLAYAHTFNIPKYKMYVTPYISNDLTLINVFGGNTEKSKNEKDESVLKIKLDNTLLFSDYINFGLNVENQITDRVKISNKINGGYLVSNNTPVLNASIGNVNTKLQGKKIDKYTLNYSVKINTKINNNMDFEAKANIDHKLRGGIGVGINLNF